MEIETFTQNLEKILQISIKWILLYDELTQKYFTNQNVIFKMQAEIEYIPNYFWIIVIGFYISYKVAIN